MFHIGGNRLEPGSRVVVRERRHEADRRASVDAVGKHACEPVEMRARVRRVEHPDVRAAVGHGTFCVMRCDVIAVFGPTASGKSAVAEALADELGTEQVSADAMQMYRGLPILTNQPDRPTRLVALWPLSHEGSVGEYQ